MLPPRLLLCLVPAIALSTLPGFSGAYSLLSSTRQSFQQRATSTHLRAEEGVDDAPQEGDSGSSEHQEGALSHDSTTDILSSPAFLKRKLDVLKSDLAAAEQDLEEAKQRLEQGKQEWGSQLDALQNEVRHEKLLELLHCQ